MSSWVTHVTIIKGDVNPQCNNEDHLPSTLLPMMMTLNSKPKTLKQNCCTGTVLAIVALPYSSNLLNQEKYPNLWPPSSLQNVLDACLEQWQRKNGTQKVQATSKFKRQWEQTNVYPWIKWWAQSWPHCLGQSQAHATAISSSIDFCGSLLNVLLCPPPLINFIRWHSASKNGIQKFISKTWSASPTIPSRQWMVHWQHLHQTLQRQ